MLTDANLRVDRRTGQVVSVTADNSIVTQDVAKDPALTAILNKYTAIAAPIANRRIGAAKAPLTTERSAAGEEVLGDIIADSQLAATAPSGLGGAEVAFMNPGGIRTSIDAGDITYGEAFAVQPFGNSLVTMTLTGAQIDRVLEQQWDGQGTSPKVLQVSKGLTYTWSASAPLGSRVDDASIKINGTTVDPAASYRVTVNSFLADGGDGFTELKQGTDRLGGRGGPGRAGGVSEPAGQRSDRAHAARPNHRRALERLTGRRAGTIHPVPARPSTPTAPEVRGAIHRRVRRVRAELWGILQTTVAAGSAWALASLLHPHPYFAPAAAVIALGVSRGGRTIRAIELTGGVAVGILVADVIVRALGANTFVLMLVVGLSMAAALLLGAGAILVNQAAISGILIVATLQPGASPSPSRFLDALIGGAIALLVGQVLFPRDPVRAMAKAARPLVSDLSVALTALAEALRDGDEQRARRALDVARDTDDDLAAFFDAVALARETFTLRHPRGLTRERVPLYAEAAQQMDYAVRNTRVLARRALSAIRRYGPAPDALAEAVALLGDAVLELGNQLEHPEQDTAARRLALEAAVTATRLLQDDPGLSISVIIGQVRSTAIDLLRGSGMTGDEARTALDAAVERAGAAP